MPYDSPGRADDHRPELLRSWNDAIRHQFKKLAGLHSKFFSLNVDELPNAGDPQPIRWFGNPAEPEHCVGLDRARAICDSGHLARRGFHNEYCEYQAIWREDGKGKQRLKRVEVTTELPEYWRTIARIDPVALRSMAAEVLGDEPTWESLYGTDPTGLRPEQREKHFVRVTGGEKPTGPLNTDRALFMIHQINGLDDLLYIVLFGAKPYARRAGTDFEKARLQDIFVAFEAEHLFCRHADPAAASGALDAAFDGRSVAFANPLGMYIQSFARDRFTYQGNPVPEPWVQLRRGEPGMYQRLEFGPSDEDAEFLDEVEIDGERVSGGYQVLQSLEVGPFVRVTESSDLGDDEYVVVEAGDRINCRQAAVCDRFKNVTKDLAGVEMTVRKLNLRQAEVVLS